MADRPRRYANSERRNANEVESFGAVGQNNFDEARDACGGLQMTDVRLDRSDQQGTRTGPTLGEDRAEYLSLQRVAELGTCPMRLDKADLPGCDACERECRANDCFLCRPIGCRETTARPILIDRTAADNRENSVTVGLGVAQALQYDHATPFAASKAVRGSGEGLAPPIGGQHSRL